MYHKWKKEKGKDIAKKFIEALVQGGIKKLHEKL